MLHLPLAGQLPLDSVNRPWFWYKGNNAEFDFPECVEAFFLVQVATDGIVVGINRVDYPHVRVEVVVSRNGTSVETISSSLEGQQKIAIKDFIAGRYYINVTTDIPSRVQISAYARTEWPSV